MLETILRLLEFLFTILGVGTIIFCSCVVVVERNCSKVLKRKCEKLEDENKELATYLHLYKTIIANSGEKVKIPFEYSKHDVEYDIFNKVPKDIIKLLKGGFNEIERTD